MRTKPLGTLNKPDPQPHIQSHIEIIARHEEEYLARRTRAERIGDNIATFVGSFGFVGVHLAIFVGWIVWNQLPDLPHYDPYPYSLLGTLVALEAVLLASFILMRQARMSHRAEERDHLELQMLLLAEKEMTALLQVSRKIAERVGLEDVANTPELDDLSQPTSVEDVTQIIRDALPNE